MLNAYMIGLLITTIFGWGAWLVVYYQLGPFTSSPELALTLFYASFFVALMASFSLLVYVFRQIMAHPARPTNDVNISLRQGAFFAITICFGAVLQREKLLTWWNGALLLLIVLLLEFYLLRKD